MNNERSSFSGRLSFVLAAAGSAVGLGNIWRFPYLAAKYGGGMFLLVYIILAVTFGFALSVTEIAIGRKTGLSAIGAFEKLHQKYRFLGILASLVPIIILPYYSVIGGWVLKYLQVFFTGDLALASQSTYFSTYTANTVEPIFWLAVFILITAAVVFFGVEKGIENVSKALMPLLVVLTIGIAVYSVTLPGAWDGFLYYITPNFSNFSIMTIVGAMGQLFYSMSLAMGIMITYGSYMKKDVNIETAVSQIELFDTGIAFFAGMMVIPAVYAFSGNNISAGPGLMFITLPKVFEAMPLGQAIGTLFFILVLLAALTSSISLMETIVSIFCDKFKMNRQVATITITLLCIIIALPSSLGFGLLSHVQPLNMSFLDFFDFISNSILMPFVALFTCYFVGYVIKPQTIIEEVKQSSPFRREKLFTMMIKYIAPICIMIILISSILNALGIVTI